MDLNGKTKSEATFQEPEIDQNTFLSPSNVFQFTMQCESISPEFCAGAKYLDLTRIALQSAGQRIAQQVLFRKTITVLVSFGDFYEPEHPSMWNMGDTSGQPLRNYKLTISCHTAGQTRIGTKLSRSLG